MKHTKTLAFASAALMALGLAGCSTPASAGKVGDMDISSGLYLLMQLNAYNEAAGLVEDTSADVLDQTVEDMPAADWIAEKTTENIRRYAGIRQLCAEHGVALSEDDQTQLDTLVESQWTSYGDYYESNGIGENTFRLALEAELLAEDLLPAIYGEDGSDPVDAAELESYIQENYTDLAYFSLPLMTPSYTFATEEQQTQIEELGKKAVQRMQDGEAMETVAAETVKEAYDIMEMEYTEDAAAVQTTTVTKLGDSVAEAVTAVFETSEGGFGSVTDSTSVVVFRRDALSSPDSLTDSALRYMKQDDLDQLALAAADEMGVALDDSARKALSVKNIKE